MGPLFFFLAAVAGFATYSYLRLKKESGSDTKESNTASALPTAGNISKFANSKPSVPPVIASGSPDWLGTKLTPPDVGTLPGGIPTTAPSLGYDQLKTVAPIDTVIEGRYGVTVEDRIEQMARAIAHAEGFGIAGTLPTRLHNPGDLINPATGEKREFGTAAEGWDALRNQIRLMYTGQSSYYSPDDTFERVAHVYTGEDNWQGWLSTVTGDLKITKYTTIRGYLSGGTV